MSIFPNKKKIQRDSEQDGLKSEFKKNPKFLQGFVETAALLI